MTRRRFLVSLVAALYFGALIGLAFVPDSAANRDMWFWPFAAFVPVGALLLLLFGRHRWWVALGFAVLGAAWLEAAQSIWMPVGYAKTSDVLWGSSGALLGLVATLLVTIPRRKSIRSHESHRIVTQGGNREIPQD